MVYHGPGKRTGDAALIAKACNIMLSTLEYGWDKEQEGIFYFLDVKGAPPQQLEWDQKLWWVHVEALVALAKGYRLTGDERCLQWFLKKYTITAGSTSGIRSMVNGSAT